MSRAGLLRRGHVLLAAALSSAPGVAHAEIPSEQQSVAATLFEQGRALMEAGRYAEACARLAESQRLDPGGGTLLNLAQCRRLEGRTSTAHALFTEALAAARRDNRDDRVRVCQQSLEELRPRLPTITVRIRAEARPRGLALTLNGVEVSALAWGLALPVDPGAVRIEVTAEGHAPFVTRALAREGEPLVIEVPALRPAPPPPHANTPPPDDRARTAGRALAVARVDIDGALRGAVTHLGLGLGLTRFAEGSLGALLGRASGFEVGARAFLPLGALRPFLTLGAPCFLTGAAHLGVRGGVGLEWSVTPHLALFGQFGAAYFHEPSAAHEQSAVLPALGLVGRL